MISGGTPALALWKLPPLSLLPVSTVNEPVDDVAVPLSSTGARRRQHVLDDAIKDLTRARKLRTMVRTPKLRMEQLDNMPPVGPRSADEFAQLVTTCKNMLGTSLEFEDIQGDQTLESPMCVRDPDRNAKTAQLVDVFT